MALKLWHFSAPFLPFASHKWLDLQTNCMGDICWIVYKKLFVKTPKKFGNSKILWMSGVTHEFADFDLKKFFMLKTANLYKTTAG